MSGSSPAVPKVQRLALFGVGVLAPLAIALVVNVVLTSGPPREVASAPERVEAPCDAARLDMQGCPPPTHCVAGRCEPLRFPVRAAAGAACAGELCEPGLECFAGICTAPEELPLAPMQCRSAAVQAAIAALRRKCQGQESGARGSLDRCEVATWEKMSATDPGFLELLGRLPGAFTVHFPADRPDPRGRWTNAVRADYRGQLAEHVARLRAARQILIIGRASVDGGTERNRELAERRSELVVSLVDELLPGGPPIRRWSLASEYGLAPERFKVDVHEVPVTWSAGRTEWIVERLGSDLKSLPGSEWQELHSMINRVVLVVPLYCDGLEFHPTPAFQGL